MKTTETKTVAIELSAAEVTKAVVQSVLRSHPSMKKAIADVSFETNESDAYVVSATVTFTIKSPPSQGQGGGR